MIFLGIETSCDDTAVALIQDRKVLVHKLYSQVKEHQPFGGVVPNIAAQSHSLRLSPLVGSLITSSGYQASDIEGIGVTAGPGLAGGLLVGVMFAKGLATSLGKPIYAVNHLQAHALVVRMIQDVSFPYLLLLMSGGHCELAIVHSPISYSLIGYPLDGAPGENLDKLGRVLGYSYPAGPSIEAAAKKGDPLSIRLPCPLMDGSCNFSFSGLKTAALRWIKSQEGSLTFEKKANFCASLQYAMVKSIGRRISNFLGNISPQERPKTAVICGGVASNQYFRTELETYFNHYGVHMIAPPPNLCTDNGVMVAWAAYERWRSSIPPSFDFSIKPRWPISA